MAESIEGIQSAGVVATVKHWVGNEQGECSPYPIPASLSETLD